MWKSRNGIVDVGLNTAFPEPLIPDSPDCAMAFAGGNCAYVLDKALANNGLTQANIFQLTGQVRLVAIWGVLTEQNEVAVNTKFAQCQFEWYDSTAAAVDITNIVDASGIAVNDMLVKMADDGAAMRHIVAVAAGYQEGATDKKAFGEGIMTQKNGADTFVRFAYEGDANTDVKMSFFCRYAPLSIGSKLVAV